MKKTVTRRIGADMETGREGIADAVLERVAAEGMVITTSRSFDGYYREEY